MGNEDEREQERGGNIPGQDQIRVDRSCVRTGSDTPGIDLNPLIQSELIYGTSHIIA